MSKTISLPSGAKITRLSQGPEKGFRYEMHTSVGDPIHLSEDDLRSLAMLVEPERIIGISSHPFRFEPEATTHDAIYLLTNKRIFWRVFLNTPQGTGWQAWEEMNLPTVLT